MPTAEASRPSARERLLDAADELFYAEGVHSVGIDRVIERADVAKATLYSAFGSKEALVHAYLTRRHMAWRERLARELAARYTTPRERLLGVFDVLEERLGEPGFRGCAFINASAEARPDGAVQETADAARTWRRTLFADLAREAGFAEPDALARKLALLYDGAMVGGGMDHDTASAADAHAIAATLLDAEPLRAAV